MTVQELKEKLNKLDDNQEVFIVTKEFNSEDAYGHLIFDESFHPIKLGNYLGKTIVYHDYYPC